MFSLITKKKQTLQRASTYFFSTVRLPTGKSLSFPLNFSGYSKYVEASQSQMFETALEQVYESGVRDGFKFAYQATLDALTQKDTEFFRDICEPRLYNEMVKGFDSLDELGLTLEGEDLDANDVKLTIDAFTMIYGVKHIRKQNYAESEYIKRPMNLNGLNLEFYQTKNMDPAYMMKLYPFIQIGCTFNSSGNILLKNDKGEILAGNNSNGCHRLVFEGVNETADGESDSKNHIQSLAQSMSGLFGAVGLFSNQGAMKNFMQRLFITKDLSWKIVDIDNHLNGNPFARKD